MRLPTGGPLEQIGKNERGYPKTPCIISINTVGFQWATSEASEQTDLLKKRKSA